MLVTDGVNDDLLDRLRKALEKAGAALLVIAPKAGGVTTKQGKPLPADHALSGAPSVFFDAVALATSEKGVKRLVPEAAAGGWLRDAFGHLKVIGHVEAAAPLFAKAGVPPDADQGMIALEAEAGVAAFSAAAKQQRIGSRSRPCERRVDRTRLSSRRRGRLRNRVPLNADVDVQEPLPLLPFARGSRARGLSCALPTDLSRPPQMTPACSPSRRGRAGFWKDRPGCTR